MSKLYFKNNKGKRIYIANVNTRTDIFNEIRKHIDKCNKINKEKGFREFQWCYTRFWYDDKNNETTFDVGSHTEFFIAEGDWTNEEVDEQEV